MRIDLHTHSSVSDGTDTPAELVAAAAVRGLDVVALTDHDTFDGLHEAEVAGQRLGVRVLRGVEMSAHHRWASVHVLGYGCRADDPELGAELARIRQGRTGRVPAMLARLAAAGMPIDDVLPGIVAGSPSVGRPHLADAMIAKGYVADRREAFDNYLADDGPMFVGRYATPLERGLDLIHGAGGVAVIAHPWGRVSRDQLPPDLLAGLAASGRLDGVEVDHQDHDAATRADLRAVADRLGLLATGSSDYHGTGKQDHDLGCNTTAPPVLAAIASLVTERGGLLTSEGVAIRPSEGS
jgi:predicted metal-dependent phosphoesterase TrpH